MPLSYGRRTKSASRRRSSGRVSKRYSKLTTKRRSRSKTRSSRSKVARPIAGYVSRPTGFLTPGMARPSGGHILAIGGTDHAYVFSANRLSSGLSRVLKQRGESTAPVRFFSNTGADITALVVEGATNPDSYKALKVATRAGADRVANPELLDAVRGAVEGQPDPRKRFRSEI